MGRQPPHNYQAEQSLLGCCLLNENAIFEAQSLLRSGDDFHADNHRTIYAAMLKLADTAKVDVVLLCEQLQRQGDLERVGGASGIAELAGAVPTSVNIEHYAITVRNLATTRRLIVATESLARQGWAAENAHEYALTCLETIQAETAGTDSCRPRTPKDLAPAQRDWLRKMREHRDIGMAWGIQELDRYLHFGLTSEIVVIAARPSVGKTALMLTLAEHVARTYGPVFVASLETSCAKVMERMNAIVCPWDDYLRATRIGRVERARVMLQHLPRLESLPLFINDSVRHVEDLVYAVRAHCHRVPSTKLICVDYLQELGTRDKYVRDREKYNLVVSKLAALRSAIQRPIVLLSQLSRAQYEPNAGPQLWHLKETSNIEQAADIVVLLWHGPDQGNATEEMVQVKIAKQRDGPIGRVKGGLRFMKAQTLFLSAEAPRKSGDQQREFETVPTGNEEEEDEGWAF